MNIPKYDRAGMNIFDYTVICKSIQKFYMIVLLQFMSISKTKNVSEKNIINKSIQTLCALNVIILQ